MNPSFHITPADIIPSETNFFAELSNDGLTFFFQKNDNKMITGLSVFSFAQKDIQHSTADILKKIFVDQELLKEKFNKTYFICAHQESIITPADHYNVNYNSENLQMVYGNLQEVTVFTDYVAEKKLYNVYRLPKDIHLAIMQHFHPLTLVHQYSLLIKQLQNTEDILKVIIYPAKIVIILQKGGKLQIVESFKYITVEDVAYHMLNLCKQFGVTNINVAISGMLEKESALITEIQKYFQYVNFSDLPGELLYAAEVKKIPAHFFNHLFAYTLCV